MFSDFAIMNSDFVGLKMLERRVPLLTIMQHLSLLSSHLLFIYATFLPPLPPLSHLHIDIVAVPIPLHISSHFLGFALRRGCGMARLGVRDSVGIMCRGGKEEGDLTFFSLSEMFDLGLDGGCGD